MDEIQSREGLYIQLQNYCRPYRPGETIVGELHTVFSTPQEFKYLSIRLEGKAEVHWTRRVSRKSSIGRIHKTIHYRDVERYFLERIKLFGDGSDNWSGSVQTLVPGNSIHPFTFTLPHNLPSSFRSLDNVAKVLYFITARLKKPWFTFDIIATIPFQVSGVLDLNNMYPETREVFILEKSRMKSYFYSQCLGIRGLIHFKIQLPQRLFAIEEVIPLHLRVWSQQGEPVIVTSLSLKLVQTLVYRTRRYRHQAAFEICQFTLCPGEEMFDIDGNYSIFLKIPTHSCPTKLGGYCKLINLQYMLKFEVELGPFTKNLQGRVPIVIGTEAFTNEDSLRFLN